MHYEWILYLCVCIYCMCVQGATENDSECLRLSSPEHFQNPPTKIHSAMRFSCAAPDWQEAAVPPGWRRKGLSLVSASQQLLQLTFGPWSKRPALSGAYIKWWTFSSCAALYFRCQTDSRNIAGPYWYSQMLVEMIMRLLNAVGQ